MVVARKDLGDELAGELKPEARAAYYRERAAHAERELADVQRWVEKGLMTQADVHAAQWEARQRETQNAELRKALSDAQMSVWEEREARLKLQASLDALKLADAEQRRKMQHVLAVAQPVIQDVSYFHGQTPDGITRGPHVLAVGPAVAGHQSAIGLSFAQTARASSRGRRTVARGGNERNAMEPPPRRAHHGTLVAAPDDRGAGGDEGEDGASENISLRGVLHRDDATAPVKPRPSTAVAARPRAFGAHVASTMTYAAPVAPGELGGRVLRTVYMPNEQVDSLSATVEALRSQLLQTEKLANERVAALVEDRRVREAQVARDSLAQRESYEKGMSKLKDVETTLAATMRDYLKLRNDSSTRQRQDAEKIALLHRQATKAKAQVKELLDKAAEHMHAQQKTQTKSKAAGFDNVFQIQLRKAEEANALLHEKYEALKLADNARIADLHAEVGRLKEHLQKLGARRAMENEGYRSELDILRRELERNEHQWARLRKHGPQSAPMLAHAADAVRDGAGVLERIRDRLEQLEEQLQLARHNNPSASGSVTSGGSESAPSSQVPSYEDV